MKHQNELFDWILQGKFANKGKIEKSIQLLTKSLAENGNAHLFIEIVDKGIDLTSYYKEMIQTAAKNGFYRLTQLIWNIIGKKKIMKMLILITLMMMTMMMILFKINIKYIYFFII